MPRRGLTTVPASYPPGKKMLPTFAGTRSASDRTAAEGFADAKGVHRDPGVTRGKRQRLSPRPSARMRRKVLGEVLRASRWVMAHRTACGHLYGGSRRTLGTRMGRGGRRLPVVDVDGLHLLMILMAFTCVARTPGVTSGVRVPSL